MPDPGLAGLYVVLAVVVLLEIADALYERKHGMRNPDGVGEWWHSKGLRREDSDA